MFLIFSPNLLRLILGWDGLGVTSYLLVRFYRSEKSFNARILTVLTNRLGDVAILSFIALNTTPAIFNYGVMSYQCGFNFFFFFLIIIAAITKRAQVPFSAWLPAAIAAPTPVSALVHSSTLVTAGVYLIMRFNFMLERSGAITIVIWLGCVTMLMAGAAAMLELDIKKIIALSTLSQLGVIFFSLGMGDILIRWAHLISHAYFKAIIFIGAGAIIHRVKDYQDVRKIGSLVSNNQFIGGVFLIGSLRLCGMPFIRGFYSKDAILEQFFMGDYSIFIVSGFFISTLLTAMYSLRVLVMLFSSFSLRDSFRNEADSYSRMSLGISILVIPSVIGGWLLSSISNSIFLVELPIWMKIRVFFGLFLITFIIVFNPITFSPTNLFILGINYIWFLPNTIRPVLNNFRLGVSKTLFKSQESSWALLIFGGILKFNSINNINSSVINSNLIVALGILTVIVIFL
jgi:NADH-ubiquinone oxidoreductase chain 5